jgi:hypothetical protein
MSRGLHEFGNTLFDVLSDKGSTEFLFRPEVRS